MSSLTTTLNASFVAGDAARLAQAQQLRAQEEAARVAQRGLPANSKITASYSFAVGSDGSLTPTETTVTTHIESDAAKQSPNRKSNNAPPRNGDQGSVSLRSIERPREDLSPSDEVTLFAQVNADQGGNPSARLRGALTGNRVDGAETASVPTTIVTLAAQAQQAAAQLYARNSDAVYNVNPLVDQAA